MRTVSPVYIRKVHHPFQKLTSTPTTFRTVVYIDDYALQTRKFLLSFVPPKQKPINHKIACFIATCKKEK